VEFRAILETLVEANPDIVLGAIFCDDEGEKVDAYHVAALDAYELALMGAAYAPVVFPLKPGSVLRVLHGLEGPQRVIWVATIEGGYYLLAVCHAPRAGAVRDELPRAVAALAAHM
jgi:hypothetical protein